ncbi:MAG: Bax inhibitor-1/YccA family protein [Saprospiraceae bacterium]
MAFRNRFQSSSNPFMKEEVMRNSSQDVLDADMTNAHLITEKMTVSGAVNKSFILFGIMLLTSAISFQAPSQMLMLIGIFGGLGIVIFASFKRHLSGTLAPIYAALEGLFVGSVTAMYAGAFGGAIVFHAVTLTFAVLFMMLFLYKTGMIKVTEKFRSGVMMATGAIFIVYLLSWVLGMFGVNIPYLHEGGMMGIGISVVIIGIAALNLLLDFDMFEKGEQYRAPKYMEWFAAMGLLITLVWLYIEILRLLAILAGRD